MSEATVTKRRKPLGKDISTLSHGYRQRVGLGQALIHDPPILILDEATSALDDATEASVIQAVQRLGREYTVVMVAYRVTTLRDCDTIYRLDGGIVSESGSYDDVLGDPLPAAGARTVA